MESSGKFNFIQSKYMNLKLQAHKIGYLYILKEAIRIISLILLSFFILLIIIYIYVKIKFSIQYKRKKFEPIIFNITINDSQKFNYINFSITDAIKEEKKQYNNYKLEKISFEEAQKYMDYMNTSKNNIILNKNNLVKSEQPKVSIVISLYNREDYINSTIKSVQNQNIKDLEIIIVDDSSTDKSVKYIKEAQKLDPRIVLLQNKKNRGTLYSKSIGVLNARGKYINSLDSDDMFCAEEYLGDIYNEAEIGNYDIIQNDAIYIDEISKFIMKRTPNFVVLWCKLIKAKHYRNIIYNIGNIMLKYNVITLDDDIIALFLFRGARVKKLKKIGICHYTHLGSHVYFRSFSNPENTRKFCTNMKTTVNAFYNVINNIGKRKGYGLYYSLFVRGGCRNYAGKGGPKSIIKKI